MSRSLVSHLRRNVINIAVNETDRHNSNYPYIASLLTVIYSLLIQPVLWLSQKITKTSDCDIPELHPPGRNFPCVQTEANSGNWYVCNRFHTNDAVIVSTMKSTNQRYWCLDELGPARSLAYNIISIIMSLAVINRDVRSRSMLQCSFKCAEYFKAQLVRAHFTHI